MILDKIVGYLNALKKMPKYWTNLACISTILQLDLFLPNLNCSVFISRIYNNQHWLIQEAEQRRLAELQQQQQQQQQQHQQQLPKGLVKQVSPAAPSPASSLISQASPSPVYENLNKKQTVKASSYNNHQRPDASVSPAHSDASWQSSQQGREQPPPLPRSNNAYPQENLYANLGSVLAPQPNFETSPLHFQR